MYDRVSIGSEIDPEMEADWSQQLGSTASLAVDRGWLAVVAEYSMSWGCNEVRLLRLCAHDRGGV